MYVAAIPYHHFFYCFALVMEHLKLFVARINIPKVCRAKHQGLSLIKFIEELFKLQMLTEHIMHECIKKLLGNVENPEEEEIESYSQLSAKASTQTRLALTWTCISRG